MTATVAVPTDTAHHHEDGEAPMDDRTAGKAFLWGLIGGGIFMTLLVFGLALAAGLDPEVAAEVAPVPGVVAGLFFGTTVYLGVHLGKNEH